MEDEKGVDEGAWIFVSHSHRDLEKVRRVRDALEAKGHNPLLFFLKCLDDEAELDDLIRREIEARTWFMLCDSPNAAASRWVRDEVEIIKNLEGKVYEVIDLDDDLDTQVERIAALSKRATVFISYARADVDVARELRTALLEHDFRVFDEQADLAPGASWYDQMDELAVHPTQQEAFAVRRSIDEALKQGFFLLLLSPDALDSRWVMDEARYAFERQATSTRSSNIIPVIARDREATLNLVSDLARPSDRGEDESVRPRSSEDLSWDLTYNPRVARLGSEFFDLTAGDLDERIAELITSLKTREME